MQAISRHEPLHDDKLRDSLPGETPWQPQQCDPGPVHERHEKADRRNGRDKPAYVQKKVLRISKSLNEIQSLGNELVSSVHEKKTAHVPLAENPYEIPPDGDELATGARESEDDPQIQQAPDAIQFVNGLVAVEKEDLAGRR